MKNNFLIFFFSSIFLLLLNISPSFCVYKDCSAVFNCGKIVDVGFPFWGEDRPPSCGVPELKLTCNNNVARVDIMQVKYRVLQVDSRTKTLQIARDDYYDGICPETRDLKNTSLDPNLLEISNGYVNLTLLYGCDLSLLVVPAHLRFGCPIHGDGFVKLGEEMGLWGCKASVIVPVRGDEGILVRVLKMEEAIREGFEVKWKVDAGGCGGDCVESGGVCGYDLKLRRGICFCETGSSSSSSSSSSVEVCRRDDGAAVHHASTSAASPGGNGSKKTSLIIGLSIGAATVLGLCLGCFVFYITQRKQKQVLKLKSKDLSSPPSSGGIPTPSTFRSNSIPSYPYSRSSLESRSSYFGAQVFTYAELEEATHNFDRSRELGDGGYGTVYFGTLKDGRIVAVKRLYENNYKRVEQFTNEVEILSKLQHPNLVKLYGSTSRHSQELLLVYEYISNGTVADHLHGKRANSSLLSWSVRLKIATETANALAYLHCNDIIHRDVKTNNILLDNNFKVKVADFGLSRLFPLDVTHVSTAPQGTPGYVDPEYYQCYQLTDKSDVYSFGVVLVELISSLQAVDINRNRNNINLSNMAIDRIQNHALSDLIDPDLGFERDYAVRSMIKSVAELAYRCLQQTRDVRPSMDEVLEILKGLENEELAARKAEVLDIGSDDVRLLRNTSSLLSSDSGPVTDKWMKVLNRTT
ncbi:LEAF RUST 10 DISEASE-RESISTANCE LOCUS RECEPTOR-LIKE PROTEIN KINASE-like 1.3 isoform X2 [Benincasa hispida]|uniref:LEAF RUST 10 DISEASE-RESISTANCE LOCUS RECEPTOR-LIKE PROTEIN KINASE-like 1.3 isoform X2 n=1 Tax=Benincasa hispida TaxID=102211 RepID=UPI00190136CD|nr:LEAF RUST 10 DISEASE-RESISTANCE LOCUS RECEPTOR-LIKE PROTEIN KINASE-like 1.3 isoform X2 [Benincasa hispida]